MTFIVLEYSKYRVGIYNNKCVLFLNNMPHDAFVHRAKCPVIAMIIPAAMSATVFLSLAVCLYCPTAFVFWHLFVRSDRGGK